MDNHTKGQIALSLYALLILSALAFVLYQLFGISLGLKKPLFKSGDCVKWTAGAEFETKTFYKVILKVGKRDYQTLLFTDGKPNYVGLDSESIQSVERTYVKTSCDFIDKDVFNTLKEN